MPMAFPAVGDLHRALFSGSNAQTLPCSGCVQMPMPPWTLPSSVEWPWRANANGLSSCRGSAQSSFFRFQDCRLAPSNPSLQRPLANANGFSTFGNLHRAFFFRFQRPNPALQRQIAFGTVACKCHWPLQTLPCSVWWPFHLVSCKCQWLFPVPRLPCSVQWQMPMACPAAGDLHRALFSGSKTAAWPLQTLPCSVQWQMPMAFPAVEDLHRALFSVPTPKPCPAASKVLQDGQPERATRENSLQRLALPVKTKKRGRRHQGASPFYIYAACKETAVRTTNSLPSRYQHAKLCKEIAPLVSWVQTTTSKLPRQNRTTPLNCGKVIRSSAHKVILWDLKTPASCSM